MFLLNINILCNLVINKTFNLIYLSIFCHKNIFKEFAGFKYNFFFMFQNNAYNKNKKLVE